MATYKLQTKNDIKFICILDREVSNIKRIIYYHIFLSLEQSDNVLEFRR